MSSDDREDLRLYSIVVNDEGQYSIWPADGQQLRGWRTLGVPRPKSECLSEIEALWTDMRPASLRAQLDADSAA